MSERTMAEKGAARAFHDGIAVATHPLPRRGGPWKLVVHPTALVLRLEDEG